jgi:hypothetical protein
VLLHANDAEMIIRIFPAIPNIFLLNKHSKISEAQTTYTIKIAFGFLREINTLHIKQIKTTK